MTTRTLLDAGAAGAPALLSPGRAPMTYERLRAQVDWTAAALRSLGVRRGDRVAIVLPNGPDAVTAFLGVASVACAAPLNPAYREPEFEFYLSDLRARTLLVSRAGPSVASGVAARLGVRVVELESDDDGAAGAFRLSGAAGPEVQEAPDSEDAADRSDDEALVLHTSGTTSRPKIVPLTHANLCASAANIAASLTLQPDDRCLNVMPLFHIHGLVAAVLASLHSGASIFCTPGFDALRFFGWLGQSRATWYTAVPTMHQAIVRRAVRNRDVIEAARLRFVRSSSSPLAPKLMAELESTFGVPAIEAYGMTEASHQIAVNPLPPGERRPGSVGLPAGTRIVILDQAGRVMPAGQHGEVAIRGPNVTHGYENAGATTAAFTDGWFRTGDVGLIDDDGYLTLTGRLREIINRGGEKIAPREVDEVLLDHPAVRQAVAFALPDDKLGEDVAAVVVLEEGAQLSVHELRGFAGARLAPFKVPRTILFRDEIPTGPTGKLQRIGLAERLGLGPDATA